MNDEICGIYIAPILVIKTTLQIRWINYAIWLNLSIENLEKVVTSLGYTLEDTTSRTIYDILAERGITGSTPGR